MSKKTRAIAINMISSACAEMVSYGFDMEDIHAALKAGVEGMQGMSSVDDVVQKYGPMVMSATELSEFLRGAAKNCNCAKCRARRAKQDSVSDL
jgi:hypothetical protein